MRSETAICARSTPRDMLAIALATTVRNLALAEACSAECVEISRCSAALANATYSRCSLSVARREACGRSGARARMERHTEDSKRSRLQGCMR